MEKAKVVNLLKIPQWNSQECAWKGRKVHAKHQQLIAGWNMKTSLENMEKHTGHR